LRLGVRLLKADRIQVHDQLRSVVFGHNTPCDPIPTLQHVPMAEPWAPHKSIEPCRHQPDGLFPTHTRPMGYTEEMKTRMNAMLENKAELSEITEEMEKIFNRQLFEEETDYSDQPVAFTHTFSRSVYDHDRGKLDDEIEALAENDGYMGILLVPDFINSEEPSLDDFFDHLEYAIDIMGIDRVGIGTDTGTGAYEKPVKKLSREQMWEQIRKQGVSDVGWRESHFNEGITELADYNGFRDFPKITEGLVSRGYKESDIKKILGNSFSHRPPGGEPPGYETTPHEWGLCLV